MNKAEIEQYVDDRLEAFRVILINELCVKLGRPNIRLQKIIYNLPVTKIIEDVTRKYGYTYQDLKAPGVKRHRAAARAMAMRQIHALGNVSFVQIGKIFDRDHSTVIHACARDLDELNFILENPHAPLKRFRQEQAALV